MKHIHKLILADDHTLVREGIKTLIKAMPEVGEIFETGDGLDAVNLARQESPTLVVLDITLPGLNGLEVAQRIKQQNSAIKVLMLSMHAGPEYVARAWKAGADGYLIKDSAFAELATAIKAVMNGEQYLSQDVDAEVVKRFTKEKRGMHQELDILTPRQRQILQLIAEGNATRDIADKLFVSVKTVESHRAQLMDRLGIHDVPGLVRFAIRIGLIENES
ncbi:response regulator transcription factor [Kangiella marina]|uniref:Response regulator transcription factor n=1 Tax=Kangiella marina TaxID=1079178 RepID=A0ABP8IJ39_9GAMM